MNNDSDEHWVPIIGYVGIYEVSDKGRVKSLERTDRMGKHWCERILTPCLNKYGYKRLSLCKDNKHVDRCVHRLVAEAFIPNPHNKSQVNHKDGDKLNNDVSNLEWVTQKENSRHAWKLGLSKISDYNRKQSSLLNSGNGNPSWRGGVSMFTKDDVLIMNFDTLSDAANWVATQRKKAYASQICECCNGRYETTYGYKWKYTTDGGFGSTEKK